MPTARYQHRPTQVTAIQYTGDNENEVERFLGPIALPASLAAAGEKTLTMQTPAGPVQLSPGCWVLRDDKDAYSALTPAQFEALYQPAGDGPPPAAAPLRSVPAPRDATPDEPDIPFDIEVEDLLERRISEAGADVVALGSLLAAITRLRDLLGAQEERVGTTLTASRELARA